MAVFVAKSVYLRRSRVRACTGSNQGDTQISEKLVQREGVSRRHDVTVDANTDDVNTVSLDRFQANILATRSQNERSHAILGGIGVGWTPSILSTCYPRASRNLIASFVKDIWKLSIGLVLALYVTFGHENFVKGPANLFTQALANLRLDGLFTLIAKTYGRLGDFFKVLRYPEQLQGARSRIQRAVGNRLIQEDEELEDTLAPVPPATE